MKKWKRKYKELKELYTKACELSRERAVEVSKLKIELGRGDVNDILNTTTINCYGGNAKLAVQFGQLMEDSNIHGNTLKSQLDNTGSDYDVDKSLRDYIDIRADETRRAMHNIRYPKDDYVNPMFVEYYKSINISTYFNEDKTPNQGWTIEKLYIKLTNEFPGISLKASTLCNSNYGSLEIPCISIYNETISLHPDGKLHWDFRKDDDILEQFISYIKKKKKN